MKIRKGTIKDATIPGKIDIANNDPVNARINLSQSDITHYIQDAISKKGAEIYIYGDGQGVIMLKKKFSGFNNCEIEWLAVKKKFQRRGIGKKLVKFAEQRAKKLQYRGIYLFTHHIRKDAHVFYKKLGYKKINKFPNYYSNGDTSIMFGKILT